MEISEVRVKLVESSQERLKAFCSITLDNEFVIRDLKIIDGSNGPFVAMPSRKLSDRCPKCRAKNHLRARFCNECGNRLGEDRMRKRGRRKKLHADVAHPINADCRQRIQQIVVDAYEDEIEKSKEPGYTPVDIDDYDYDGAYEEETMVESGREEESSGGYEDLIADLKRDAAKRGDDDGLSNESDEDDGNRHYTLLESVEDDDDTGQNETSTIEEPEMANADQEQPSDDFGAGIL